MSQAQAVVNLFFNILIYLLFARVILSWLPTARNNPLVRFIYEITEPLLSPFRRIMPRTGMPVDFSPILAFFVLQIVRNFIIRML